MDFGQSVAVVRSNTNGAGRPKWDYQKVISSFKHVYINHFPLPDQLLCHTLNSSILTRHVPAGIRFEAR